MVIRSFVFSVRFSLALGVGVALAACGSDQRGTGKSQQSNLAPFIDHGTPTSPGPGPSTPPTSPGCGAIDEAGTCSGDVYMYCSAGTLKSVDCAMTGKSCVVDDFGDATCQGSTIPSGSCGAVTEDGMCTGSIVVWCEAGSLQTYNCAMDGSTCSTTFGYADCF